MKQFNNILLLLIASILISCSAAKITNEVNISYDNFQRKILFPKPDTNQLNTYNRNIIGTEKTIPKDNGKTYHGFVTSNKEFYEKMIKPILIANLDELSKLNKTELINRLVLFCHEIFRTYFGKDFYRWGGDIMDLDDPQERGVRFNRKYGLDCSGFSTMAYEIAVNLNLLDYKSEGALFCSRGYEYYCKLNNISDEGGRDNGSNNFRVDTKDISKLGRVIFTIEKGAVPTEDQIKKLQPGDLVSKQGHVGIIVEINDQPYYLESGGVTVPRHDGFPCIASESLRAFARNFTTTIRRALPDNNK